MDTYKVGIMEKFGEEKSSKIFSFYYKKIYVKFIIIKITIIFLE